MNINLLSEKELNNFIAQTVYGDIPIAKVPNLQGIYESVDFVNTHKRSIILGIVNKWIKLRIRQNVALLETETAFVKVDKNRTDLPNWCNDIFNKGFDIYDFVPDKVSGQLRSDIITVRDYLYNVVEQYIDSVLEKSVQTNSLPQINYAWLTNNNEYESFESVLKNARKTKSARIKNGTLKIKQKIAALRLRIADSYNKTIND